MVTAATISQHAGGLSRRWAEENCGESGDLPLLAIDGRLNAFDVWSAVLCLLLMGARHGNDGHSRNSRQRKCGSLERDKETSGFLILTRVGLT